MARKKKATPEVENVQGYLEGVAKNLVDRLYGPKGPAWGTKLTEIEDVLLELREHLTEEMMAQILQKQAQTAAEAPPKYARCPKCQQPVKGCEPEPRIVKTRVGQAEWSEPQDYCRKCRRAFFPSVQESWD